MEKVIIDRRKRAIDLNSGEEYYYLAQCYEDINQFGDPNPYFDNFRRILFYLKAGHLGYAEAYNNLANIIEVDMRDIKNYRQRAKMYYKLASDLGSDFGQDNYKLFLKQEEFPTCFKLILTIVGEKLNHKTLSTILQTNPTAFWHKGDDIRKFKYSYGQNQTSWQYEFDFVVTLDFNTIANSFKSFLDTKIDEFTDYIVSNALRTQVNVLVDINYKNVPDLHLDKEFLTTLERLNGTINFKVSLFDGFEDEK
ncbi:DUF4279 domain-containing protein [Myroides odoratus]